jgi:arsenite methyltransferase
MMAARRVPAGRAVGVDLWRSVDRSGNNPATARGNAAAEGVSVDLLTGDMWALPVGTGSVDLVVSSLAIHNIPDLPGRLRAVAEAARIVRPGGRVLIGAKRELGWTPRYPSWRQGFPAVYGATGSTQGTRSAAK